MLLASHSELLQAKTKCDQLERELKARTVQIRSTELQLQQSTAVPDISDEQAIVVREINTLRAQLVSSVSVESVLCTVAAIAK